MYKKKIDLVILCETFFDDVDFHHVFAGHQHF
jgi:hypothetical protein